MAGQKRKAALVGGVCLTLLIAGCGSDEPENAGGNGDDANGCAETYEVKYGAVGSVTDAGIILAEELGHFEDNCIDFTFEKLADAAAITTALASDAIQVAGVAQSPGLFTGISQGLEMKIVGDKQACNVDLCSNGILVRKELVKDTDQETWESLKGLKFAINSTSNNVMYQVELYLRQFGLTPDDFEFTIISYPDSIGAIDSNRVQIAQSFDPYATQALNTGCCEFFSWSELEAVAVPAPTLVPLVYGPRLLSDEYKDAAQGFMNAYVLGVRAYNDALLKDQDRERIFGLIAGYPVVNVDPAEYEKMHKAFLDPNQLAVGDSLDNNVRWLEDLQEWYIEHELMPAEDKVDPRSMFDLSFAEAAVAQFGEYEF